MQNSSFAPRLILAISALVVAIIGFMVAFTPDILFASSGVSLGPNPSLRTEIRAPGALLLSVAVYLAHGAMRAKQLTGPLLVAAAVFLSYGAGRLVSLGLDGLPDTGLLIALAIELGLGAAALWAWIKQSRRKAA
ncbi:MAG: DUF4345 domain-containing protein [Mangrovicoccus sp.]